MPMKIVGNNKGNVVYIRLENIDGNDNCDWFKEKEHEISCTLTCAANEKALVYRQILFGDKERFKKFYAFL